MEVEGKRMVRDEDGGGEGGEEGEDGGEEGEDGGGEGGSTTPSR